MKQGTGLIRKKRGSDGKREQRKSEVPCPHQNRDYSETFHLIDKGNGAEANYDMGGHSKGHNWSPKLTMRFFNMNMNNAGSVFDDVMAHHNIGRRKQSMPARIQFLSHNLMQRGETMRTRKAEHPKHTRDLTNVFDFGTGRKQRSDAKGRVAGSGLAPGPPPKRISLLRQKQMKSPWRTHQSKAHTSYGKCCWVHCPGYQKSKAKRKRSYDTFMRCEECSAMEGKNRFFCNDHKKGAAVHCHEAYHNKYHNKKR